MKKLLMFGLITVSTFVYAAGIGIPVEKLTMDLPAGDQFFTEALMVGEIAETDVAHTILVGPQTHREKLSRKKDHILIFFKGRGSLSAGSKTYEKNQRVLPSPIQASEFRSM